MTIDALNKEIIQLPKNEQFSLAKAILNQLGSSSTTNLSTEKIAEADRRFQEINNGVIKGIPSNQVYSRLKKKYAPRN